MFLGRTKVPKLIPAHMITFHTQPSFDTALISPTLRYGQMSPFGENWTIWRVMEWNDHITFHRKFLRGNNVEFPLRIGL